MRHFTFYKENKTAGKFEMPLDEIKGVFVEWMGGKDRDWLEYYSPQLVSFFVTNRDGLNSTADMDELNLLTNALKFEKHRYFKSIGVH